MGRPCASRPEGRPAPGNPFIGKAGRAARDLVARASQRAGRGVRCAGRFWIVEHGTRGGDELNLVEGGKNYGWPLQAYGIEYSGAAIEGAVTNRPGYQQPVYYWDPVIAPSGAQFYTGDAFPEWKGNLFIGSLKEKRLVRVVIESGRVVARSTCSSIAASACATCVRVATARSIS
jgi:glucose/arabinose dehydrogenase